MKKAFGLLLPCVLLAACGTPTKSVTNHSVNEIAPYPEAKAGYSRSVIYLPELKNEENAKVELLIGKNLQVDCNIQRLTGTVKEETLTGWGYTYYVVDKVAGPISTMMACPTSETKSEFVTMNSNLDILNYNSRLPIVIYTPSDIEVKYKVWQVNNDKEISAIVE